MRDSLPEYVSGVDFKRVNAAKIRMIELEPRSGKMVLKFTENRFPPLILNANKVPVPSPGSWVLIDESCNIEFKSEIEFLAEFRQID